MARVIFTRQRHSRERYRGREGGKKAKRQKGKKARLPGGQAEATGREKRQEGATHAFQRSLQRNCKAFESQ